MSCDVLAIDRWKTNAELMADVARLGYLDGTVLDATYGLGNFWTVYRPENLSTNDLYTPADMAYDFTDFHDHPDGSYDVVVFDPPYKLSGTPALGQFDKRYGLDVPLPLAAKIQLILDGVAECWRLARKYLLVKCQDQVVCGKVLWQTDLITQHLAPVGARKVDRFDFVYTPRPQRSQVHARRNASQLLVFGR